MIFAAPETGFGIDGNWFEDRRKAPLRKQTQRPRTGLLLDLVELVELKEIHVFFNLRFLYLTVNILHIYVDYGKAAPLPNDFSEVFPPVHC